MKDLNKSKRTIVSVIAIVLALTIIWVVYRQRQPQPQVQLKNIEQLSSLAQCLKESGAVFYGTASCSHCQNQKEMFGEASSQLPYVECSAPDGSQLTICSEKEISGYPTWIFANGNQALGSLSIFELAARTGCPL